VDAVRVPPPDAEAVAVFGDQLELATRYVELLAGPGIERGLLGPREVPRLWERHVLNCAVTSEVYPVEARVVDVGSGAGLPGLALAIRRPDLRVDLIESLERRCAFLAEAAAELSLSDRVQVVRGRAEDVAVRTEVGGAPWVTARAVAPLDRLVGWCLPLLRPAGSLVALKGAAAESEIAECAASIKRQGGGTPRLVQCGESLLREPTTVVIVVREGQRVRDHVKGRG
jgi:16S rRNA (guanine527-N7)-methyltransferase